MDALEEYSSEEQTFAFVRKAAKNMGGTVAAVSKGNVDYRIDKKGKKVYTFKESDLAICHPEFKKSAIMRIFRMDSMD